MENSPDRMDWNPQTPPNPEQRATQNQVHGQGQGHFVHSSPDSRMQIDSPENQRLGDLHIPPQVGLR
jgi:hypothetical protein